VFEQRGHKKKPQNLAKQQSLQLPKIKILVIFPKNIKQMMMQIICISQQIILFSELRDQQM
jgi:hypothetical protein